MFQGQNNVEYWYFRFTQRFITDRPIQRMKHLPGDIGYKYIVIYEELCSLSLPYGGYIRVDKNTLGLGYAIDLGKDIGENADDTAQAMTYLISNGLVEVTEDSDGITMFLPVVENNIGRSSLSADRRRKLDHEKKARLSGRNEDPGKLSGSAEKTRCAYGSYENVFLSDLEYRALEESCRKLQAVINDLSIHKAFSKEVIASDFDACIEYARFARLLEGDPRSLLQMYKRICTGDDRGQEEPSALEYKTQRVDGTTW